MNDATTIWKGICAPQSAVTSTREQGAKADADPVAARDAVIEAVEDRGRT
jgi:hypothetical protein